MSIPLSLYIHFPWCVRKCPYCDFNSHSLGRVLPESLYLEALLADLHTSLPLVTHRQLETIFMGGGTPSLFTCESIAFLLQQIGRMIEIAPDAEITLEANPATVDEEILFSGFRKAGVNRLSIGVQSFHSRCLERLGRVHGPNEALLAIELAKKSNFTNINIDMMFGLPDQTLEEAFQDIKTAVATQPQHISLYQLTIEPQTAFYKHPPALPNHDVVWDMQTCAQAFLAESGYEQYEVSAYAKQGFSCRHNLNYWQFGDYLGIGAGAHSKITHGKTITRIEKIRHPLHYIEASASSVEQSHASFVTETQRPFEFLMNALRLCKGFSERQLFDRTGLEINVLQPILSNCFHEGLLEQQGEYIRCTELGYRFLDDVLQRFLL